MMLLYASDQWDNFTEHDDQQAMLVVATYVWDSAVCMLWAHAAGGQPWRVAQQVLVWCVTAMLCFLYIQFERITDTCELHAD